MITVTSNAVETAARFDVAIAAIPAASQTALTLAAEGIRGVIMPAMAARTPVRCGALQQSTTSSVEEVPGGVDITVSQPAKSAPNQDGSGGGQYYVRWVVLGRGPIVAPSSGPYSTGKKALRTPFGIFKSVRPAAPNNYPVLALADAAAGMESAARAGALAGVRTIMVPLR